MMAYRVVTVSMPVSPSTDLPREAVIRELDAIIASEIFVNSSRLSRFLRYVVERTLDGGAERLKEYQIGVDVFEKRRDYDQRTDPVVRVEARQLRFKLSEYYAGLGRDDEVVISLPKGGYAARFERRMEARAELVRPAGPVQEVPVQIPPVSDSGGSSRGRLYLGIAVGVLAAMVAAGVLLRASHKPQNGNSEAQQLYLTGRFYWTKRTPESLNLAVDYFTQAIARQPNYAAAYAGLADAYNLLSEYTIMPFREAFSRARAAAQKAVELDDSLADAHRALAYASFWGGWDSATADREFTRALELNPNSAVAHHWFATFLSAQGRHSEALAEIDRAQQLDPAASSIVADKASILDNSGHRREAIALASQVAGADPSFLSAHSYLAQFYLEDGDYTDYLREARTAALLEHDTKAMQSVAAGQQALETGGAHSMLEAMLQAQQRSMSQGASRNYALASSCARLGEKAKALDYLQAALANRETSLLALRMDSTFGSLHGDPRFQKILSDIRP
jgi:tetratricopeptide (TPR) repeat protein